MASRPTADQQARASAVLSWVIATGADRDLFSPRLARLVALGFTQLHPIYNLSREHRFGRCWLSKDSFDRPEAMARFNPSASVQRGMRYLLAGS
jgi:hypothetical protein